MASIPNPTVDELEKKEEEEFRSGPLSVLTTSVKTNSQVCGPLAPYTIFTFFDLRTCVCAVQP